MSKLEIELHDGTFFLDRLWEEDGIWIRKNIASYRNYDDALEAKRFQFGVDARMSRVPSLLEACKTALMHVQLLGSGQPSPLSNSEMCTLLGDAIEQTEGRR
jgi:hypothetical protein